MHLPLVTSDNEGKLGTLKVLGVLGGPSDDAESSLEVEEYLLAGLRGGSCFGDTGSDSLSKLEVSKDFGSLVMASS